MFTGVRCECELSVFGCALVCGTLASLVGMIRRLRLINNNVL